jgi:hypothetical protein
MEVRPGKFSRLFLLIAGGAAILFGTLGFARMSGWSPGLVSDPLEVSALDQEVPAVTSEAGARPRCPECGVIVSMREIEKHGTSSDPGAPVEMTAGDQDGMQVKSNKHYEITVRMADGSSRLIYHANPARWRSGERLMVIAGTDSSSP